MEYQDYYKVLGVERDAAQDEIKRAYRKLARRYHPDVSKEADAEACFKDIGEAYEVLKDPEKRAAYDQLGANWKDGQDFRPPPGWDQGFEFHGGGDAGRFSDFFESLFGRAGFGGAASHGRAAPMRGADTYARIMIDIEDAYQGTTRTLTLKQSETGPDGRPAVKERALNVRVPKGVRQGQHIRLSGQGGTGVGKGQAGDLYLEAEFRPHPFYTVNNKDVYLSLPLAPWEAALGATVTVPTPSGKVDVRVPPGSTAGSKLRLKGRGIPATEAGNFYVVLQIVLPPAEGESEKAAYHALSKAFEFSPRRHLGV